MRGSIALRKTIATTRRMIAVVAATVAGCLALLMTFVWGLVGASTASAASTTYTIKDLGTLPVARPPMYMTSTPPARSWGRLRRPPGTLAPFCTRRVLVCRTLVRCVANAQTASPKVSMIPARSWGGRADRRWCLGTPFCTRRVLV